MSLVLYTEWGAVAGEFLAGEVLAGASGDQLTLPASLVLQDEDATWRSKSEDRAISHGTAVYSSGWDSRDVVVQGSLKADDAATLHAQLRALRAAAVRPDQYLLVDDERYLLLSALKKMDVSLPELWDRSLADVRLAWIAGDPFWYAAAGETHSEGLAGDGSFAVDGGDVATVEMPLRIRILAPAGGTPAPLTLTSATDGRGFTFSDRALTDGAILEVDTEAGTVRLNGVAAPRFFSGSWPSLRPGANTWSYTGGACTIEFSWRPRWA
jgi:hypothetical protein